ncbi:hypothetical protein IMZ11_30920 [Microtetraspora sp. AC03309]|uniref:hypothetical protein n=1 Tax=Microtetraspora sp. AC03309 TaxID=2779376 RepID=UPI001E474F28|nr:hypothetical protein [Microtetraspora sp. AC03309]MCC5580045.1 hypothetical protein [Microtetraspora sp. AC03309]
MDALPATHHLPAPIAKQHAEIGATSGTIRHLRKLVAWHTNRGCGAVDAASS